MRPNAAQEVQAPPLMPLLTGFASLFTAPSFRTFTMLACGFAMQTGKRPSTRRHCGRAGPGIGSGTTDFHRRWDSAPSDSSSNRGPEAGDKPSDNAPSRRQAERDVLRHSHPSDLR